MDQKKKDDLKNQDQFKLFDDKPGSYLDDLEDIFDPEDNEEIPVIVEPVGWTKCKYCGQVIKDCSGCHRPVEMGDALYCIYTGKNSTVHYCDKCMANWMITGKGKEYLKNLKSRAHTG